MSPLRLPNPFCRDPETPTLKERGAALKAGLARVSRNTATPTPEPSPVPAEPQQDASGLGALADDIIACWEAEAAIPEESRADGGPLYEQWYARRDELLDAAAALPATRDNLAAKALALAWLEYPQLWERGAERQDYATDGQLAFDINAAITTEPVPPPIASPAFLPDIDFVGRLDLATVTMGDLQALHDIANMVSGVAYATTWQERCKARGPGGAYNVAGTLMQDLADALADVEGAAAQEARRRSPDSGRDRGARLEIIARSIIQNGDPEEVATLAREMNEHAAATWGARS